MHGARGGAPRGKAHGQYRHGGRSIEVMTAARLVNALARFARGLEA